MWKNRWRSLSSSFSETSGSCSPGDRAPAYQRRLDNRGLVHGILQPGHERIHPEYQFGAGLHRRPRRPAQHRGRHAVPIPGDISHAERLTLNANLAPSTLIGSSSWPSAVQGQNALNLDGEFKRHIPQRRRQTRRQFPHRRFPKPQLRPRRPLHHRRAVIQCAGSPRKPISPPMTISSQLPVLRQPRPF